MWHCVHWSKKSFGVWILAHPSNVCLYSTSHMHFINMYFSCHLRLQSSEIHLLNGMLPYVRNFVINSMIVIEKSKLRSLGSRFSEASSSCGQRAILFAVANNDKANFCEFILYQGWVHFCHNWNFCSYAKLKLATHKMQQPGAPSSSNFLMITIIHVIPNLSL